MTADWIGWMASAVLLATLVRQIVKQYREPGEGGGVSVWLFIGQATASALFVVYSILLDNHVFIATNSCLLVTAIVGQWLTRRARQHGSREGHASPPPASRDSMRAGD